jgi:hypothetical protein
MKAALKTIKSFKKYTDDEVAGIGGRSVKKDDPVPAGSHKIAVYRRAYIKDDPDFHYATQDDDGTWSEKETEDSAAENLDDPDNNWVWG